MKRRGDPPLVVLDEALRDLRCLVDVVAETAGDTGSVPSWWFLVVPALKRAEGACRQLTSQASSYTSCAPKAEPEGGSLQ